MADTSKRLCKGTLTSSNATLYTVPASTTTYIKAVTFCNTTSSDHTINLKFAGTNIITGHTLTKNNTLTVPFFDQIISATELIEASSDANSAIDYYISGREVV